MPRHESSHLQDLALGRFVARPCVDQAVENSLHLASRYVLDLAAIAANGGSAVVVDVEQRLDDLEQLVPDLLQVRTSSPRANNRLRTLRDHDLLGLRVGGIVSVTVGAWSFIPKHKVKRVQQSAHILPNDGGHHRHGLNFRDQVLHDGNLQRRLAVHPDSEINDEIRDATFVQKSTAHDILEPVERSERRLSEAGGVQVREEVRED